MFCADVKKEVYEKEINKKSVHLKGLFSVDCGSRKDLGVMTLCYDVSRFVS